MKRILLLLLCILLMFSFSITVSAEENGIYENAGQLYEAWVSQDKVPDYISGVWSTDGGQDNLTFCLVRGEAGEKGKKEILDLVIDDSTITFVYQTYSRNYLYQIQEAVVDEYFGKQLGLVTAGVNEYENKVCFEVHRDYANNSDTLAMIQEVTNQYGDAVYFSYIDYYPQCVTGTESATTPPFLVMANPQKHVMPIGLIFVFFPIAMAFLLYIEIRRRQVLALMTDGTSVSIGKQLSSKKEIENDIRKANIAPSESLDDRVMQSIMSLNKDNH